MGAVSVGTVAVAAAPNPTVSGNPFVFTLAREKNIPRRMNAPHGMHSVTTIRYRVTSHGTCNLLPTSIGKGRSVSQCIADGHRVTTAYN